MLRKHSHSATSAFMKDNRLFIEFKGALTKNFVLQSMLRQFEVMPRYWANAPYEVDFVIQRENDIIPVEAKAGTIQTYLKEVGSSLYGAVDKMDFVELCKNMNIVNSLPEYTKYG